MIASSPGAQIVGGRAPPFAGFAAELDRHEGRRAALDALYRAPETEVVPALIAAADLPPEVIEKAQALARKLVTALRERPAPGLVQSLMREYALSSQEGVALMCLSEALLRVPDAATRNALIADKIGGAEWRAHLGNSPSPFVNAATWGLLITGQLVSPADEKGLMAALTRLDRALRRADHPHRRRHRDARARRAVRLRPDDRGGARPTRDGWRRAAIAIPTTCSARRRRPRRTPSAISPPTKRRSTRSARPRAGAAFTKAPACRSSSRRCIRAIGAAKRRRAMTELYPRLKRLAVLARSLRRRLQHRRGGSRAARPVARPARDLVPRSGRWRRGTASAS